MPKAGELRGVLAKARRIWDDRKPYNHPNKCTRIISGIPDGWVFASNGMSRWMEGTGQMTRPHLLLWASGSRTLQEVMPCVDSTITYVEMAQVAIRISSMALIPKRENL
jgi:hypothetical protein